MREVYNAQNHPPKVKVVCTVEEGRTRQADKDACDINKIVSRYEKTGVVPAIRQGWYADVSSIGDYTAVVNRVKEVERVFNQLPASMRANFDNEPSLFLDYLANNPGGLDELGIKEEPSEAPEPAGVEGGEEPPVGP